MKISRQKKVQKHLNFYKNNFKFREPFQVLIDGTFAFAALEAKFNIKEQITKYFQAEVKLLTTQCMILETEKLAQLEMKLNGALRIIKQFPLHKCGHEKNSISGSKCFNSMLANNNSSRYIIATQDRQFQDHIRRLRGVPLLYLHDKAPTLERPSEATCKHAEELRNGTITNSLQVQTVKILKQKSGLEETEIKLKKKRKKGGPNPLSCKKKQKKSVVNQPPSSGKIRKRKRIKISSHVKDALQKEISS
ncbi:rRNA-processing protein UTP23 homolog [Leptopilina heterotoma]|uniref:rRNA-processing protein UTP23 homolog n=1 Tax=Leptopilina heterotoma TaxID=63436 RepID=UPI001CA7DF09|nr:rRNA-processing protein UTP23 homolog [Leptopilina heterotoma]